MNRIPGLWQRLTRGWRRLVARPAWVAAAGEDYGDTIMKLPVTDRYHSKQGRSTGRLILNGDHGRLAVYLKRHYQLPWLARCMATLFPKGDWSPAMIEYRNLLWARDRGLRVPEPLAVGQWVGPGMRLQSFLAIEELGDMVPLHEAIPSASMSLPPSVFERWKRRVIIELARMARILHEANRYHKDLYLCHFFVPRSDIGAGRSLLGRVYLIDLHRLGRHTWLGGHYRRKDLAQLLFSTDLPGVTGRDRLRFFHHYRKPGRLECADRVLFQSIRRKAERYRLHNDKHPRLMPDRQSRREAS